MAAIAEGMRISSLSRVKEIKEDTILDWLRSAGAESLLGIEGIETVFLAEDELSRGPLDGLWSYVGNKGKKGYPKTALCGRSMGGPCLQLGPSA